MSKAETGSNTPGLNDRLFEAWSKFDFDPSHGREHIELVLKYSMYLCSIYDDADQEIVTAAAILHDLGRSNRDIHQQLSRQGSIRLTRPILEEMGYSNEKIDGVCIAIEDHDQMAPARTLEGKILKDADFLAGFGIEGVKRIIVWTLESGGVLDDIIDRLKVKMPKRIAALEFSESQKIAEELQKNIVPFLNSLPG